MTNMQDLFFSGLVGGLLGNSGTTFSSGTLKKSWSLRLCWAWKCKWLSLLLIGLSFSLLGLVSGLSSGVPWYANLRDGFISGISTGLISIMLALLIEADLGLGLHKIPRTKANHLRSQHSTIVKHIYFGASAGLLIGFCVGLSEGLSGGALFGQSFSASLGIGVGLSEGLHFGIISLLLSILLFGKKKTIEPAERIIWSVKYCGKKLLKKRHLMNTLCILLVVGLLTWLSEGLGLGLFSWLESVSSFGPFKGLAFGLSENLNAGLSAGLSVGLAYWILLGLWDGISHEVLSDQHRATPNQGIRNSGHNSLLIGLVTGGVSGCIGFLSNILFVMLTGKPSTVGLDIALSEGFILIGISGGLLAGLLMGGLVWYRHNVLRHVLVDAGVIPWDYIRFLDDATARFLLRRVGGGYSFSHRLLLDHLADMETGAMLSPHASSTEFPRP